MPVTSLRVLLRVGDAEIIRPRFRQGAEVPMLVTVLDQDGQPVAGATVALAVVGLVTVPGLTTDAAGQASAVFDPVEVAAHVARATVSAPILTVVERVFDVLASLEPAASSPPWVEASTGALTFPPGTPVTSQRIDQLPALGAPADDDILPAVRDGAGGTVTWSALHDAAGAAGSEAGAQAGAEAGGEAGGSAGATAGAVSGAASGASAGAEAGALAGAAAGATSGATAGAAAAEPYATAAAAAADTITDSVANAGEHEETLPELLTTMAEATRGALGIVYGLNEHEGVYRSDGAGGLTRVGDTQRQIQAALAPIVAERFTNAEVGSASPVYVWRGTNGRAVLSLYADGHIDLRLTDEARLRIVPANLPVDSIEFSSADGLDELPILPVIRDAVGKRALGVERASGGLDFRTTTATRLLLRASKHDLAHITDRRPHDGDNAAAGYAIGEEWAAGGIVYRARTVDGSAVWTRAAPDPYIIAGVANVIPLPGDAVAGAVPLVAIGMGRMRLDYDGPAILLGRDSDAETLDVPILPDHTMDWAALVRFISGTKGRVLTVYNQGSGADLTWTGTDAPVVSLLPSVGEWFAVVFENSAPSNGEEEPRQGLLIPSSITASADNHSVLACVAFCHSSANTPVVEFDVGATEGAVAFFKRDSSSFVGLRVMSVTDGLRNGASWAPHLAGQVVGYTSSTEAMTIYTADRDATASAALSAETWAGGRIALTTTASTVGSSKREGDLMMGGLLIYDRALTAEEYALARVSLTHHARLRPQVRATLICDGDSITRGAGATYYDGLPRRIARHLAIPVQVFNFGISGSTSASPVANFEPWDAVAHEPAAPLNIFYLSIGTNDLTGDTPLTPAETYANIKSWVALVKALDPDALAVIGTIRPRRFFWNNPEIEANRQEVISLLVAGWSSDIGADLLVDYSDQPVLGEPDVAVGDTYYPDGTHQSDLARQLEAPWVADKINALLATRGYI